jgi:DNA topoisomerase-1
MEDALDAISRGEEEWIPLLDSFWQPFHERVTQKLESVDPGEAKGTRILGTDPKSGKPVSVRVGRFGPYAQIGTREDEDKPRFAGLLPGQSVETVTLEEALELFKLPRELGTTEDGDKVSAAIGRFGPYIRYGNKFVSLKDADPLEVTLEHALKLIADKKEFDANRIIKSFRDSDIQILRGRYGPYLTDGNKNARLPKDREPESLTREECEALIAAAPDRKRGKKSGRKKAGKKKTRKKTSRKKISRKKTGKKTSRKKTPGSGGRTRN